MGAKPDVAGKIELHEVGFRHGDAAIPIARSLSCFAPARTA